MAAPHLSWDLGTAYDLFVSLEVLHDPATYGVRGVWAAGMRSRLPAAERDFLEQVQGRVFGAAPLHWVHALPEPKSSADALDVLARTPAAERLPALAFYPGQHPDREAILLEAAARGAWGEADQAGLVEAFREQKIRQHRVSRRDAALMLDWWARPEEFGERYLRALAAYYEVFFAEEERRITPALQAASSRAQTLAARLPIPALIEELSQGVSLDSASDMAELVLAPSYWSSPLIYYKEIGPGRMMMLFGARPDDASLVPGEVVPAALLLALKALDDPTRLRILHYLGREALTPTQLAHRLRLRAPTVVHHLQTLRVAGLVQVRLAEGKERSYALRPGSVQATSQMLERFLAGEPPE